MTTQQSQLQYRCDAGTLCPPFDLDPFRANADRYWRYQSNSEFKANNFWQIALHTLMHRRMQLNIVPLLIAIGPALLEEDDAEYTMLSTWPLQLKLVEPNAMTHKHLLRRVADLGFKISDKDIIAAAVCPTDQDNVTFYLSPNCNTCGGLNPYFSHYFETTKTQIRCISPSGLLNELGVEAKNIDMIHMDCEGHDLQILELFIELDGFAPMILKFQWYHETVNNGHKQISSVMRKLSTKGYDLHTHGLDVFAIAKHLT